ncbi:von Willebrand factor type A domain-containing protein [Lentinula raphanica]|nr:von Willebrand factor type A domain-containing protein [Lentinula raphanica]
MARTRLKARGTRDCCLYDSTTGDELLLDGSSVDVLIADVHASVTLSQRFTNTSSTTVNGVYTFSLMAGAAVCGFEMIRQDGTRVEGLVSEKEEASRKYELAIKAGKTASLGQQETADVFSISVGNVLLSETVEIKLRYIQLLMDDEKKDQVKFIFPRTYAQRYGQAPTSNSASATTAHQPFVMNVIVQQSGIIKSISCPSAHPIQFELGLPDGFEPESDNGSHFASVTLTDTSGALTQDVVLVVCAADLDSPRCFVEQHPSPNHETTAMALTFVPRFTLPDIKGGMEYVFVVDRSGSMQGERIKLVREALIVLLRGLPTYETTFNIISFGSRTTKLWDQSRQYSQTTLEEATKHVDTMRADYGGTEIAAALSSTYSSLQTPLARPVAVILLTDGSAWDVSTCVSHTQTALSTLPQPKSPGNPSSPSPFIRVFTVGIGDGASSDTCDSIARAGNGMAVYVKEGEAVAGKCARVVRAARSPQITGVVVSWLGDAESGVVEEEKEREDADEDFEMVEDIGKEDGSEVPVKNLFKAEDEEQKPTGPPPAPVLQPLPPPIIQQAPLPLTNIFPGTRTQVYAIIRTPPAEDGFKGKQLPTSVKVKGVLSTTGAPVELIVPVSRILRPLKPANSDEHSPSVLGQPFLHVLAAKSLITEHQDGRHSFPASVATKMKDNEELKEAYLKQEIIRLGTTYGLTSKYTSFIAVDHRTNVPSAESSSSTTTPNPNPTEDEVSNIIPVSGFSESRIAVQSRRVGSGKAPRMQLASRAARKTAVAATIQAVAESSDSDGDGSSIIPLSLAQSRAPRDKKAGLHKGRGGLSRGKGRVASNTHARPRPAAFVGQQASLPSSSTSMDVDQTSAEDTRPTKRARGVPSYLRLASTSTTTPSTPLTIAGRLTAIARLQQFDGS